MSSEVAENFRGPLEELKMNSKPQISMLTMLAEDSVQDASEIVRVIQEQISKVVGNRKLPIMYLIDSIMKNLPKSSYPTLFASCIVDIFCGVFEEVDESIRSQLYKLRQTWVDILPNKRLYALDVRIQTIDSNWPVTAKQPDQGVIHVNPRFLKSRETREKSPQFSPVHSAKGSPRAEDWKEELLAKEKELQKLRLELELAETKAKLEQRNKQLEEQQMAAMQKVGRKLIQREPPAAIALPPVATTKTQPATRDPRLNRDPRMRDPRLQKQFEKQEQARLIEEEIIAKPLSKPASDVVKRSDSASELMIPSSQPDTSSSVSPKMDLASLLNSFTVAAHKVHAEQVKKKSEPMSHTSSHTNSPIKNEKPNSKSTSSNKVSKSENVGKSQGDIQMEPKGAKDFKFKEKDRKEKSSNQERQSPSKPNSQDSRKDLMGKDTKPSYSEKKKSEDSVKEVKSQHPSKNNRSSSKERYSDTTRDESRSNANSKREKADRRESERTRTGERREMREKKSQESGRSSPRRNYRRSPPEQRRETLKESRSNATDGKDRQKVERPIHKSSDGKTDQFGRILQTEAGKERKKSDSRDRSPINKPKGSTTESLKVEDVIQPVKPLTKTDEEVKANIKKDESSHVIHDVPVSQISSEDQQKKPEIKISEDGKFKKGTFTPVEQPEVSNQLMELEDINSPEAPDEKDTDMRSEDTDMRSELTNSSPKKQSIKDVNAEIEKQEPTIVKKEDENYLKRPNPSEEKDGIVPAPPYKIPKLTETKEPGNEKNEEKDISQLFGGEDVDYRNLSGLPKPLMIPPPMPNHALLSPLTPSSIKSPAQQRWNQFKENHPSEFAQDMERKRMRNAQMHSIDENVVQDEDLRHLTRQPPHPPSNVDINVPIPKGLSMDNQQEILRTAEQKLKDGIISHGEHQEIVRQLGQVYDMQKKRQSHDEIGLKSLDMRDPRLRGIREGRASDAEEKGLQRQELADEIDQRKRRVDIPDDPVHVSPRYSEKVEHFGPPQTSPKADFDGRRIPMENDKFDNRMKSNSDQRSQAFDFDSRSRSPRDHDVMEQDSQRDYDERVPAHLRNFEPRIKEDYDARPHRGREDYRHRGRRERDNRPHVDDRHRDREQRDDTDKDDVRGAQSRRDHDGPEKRSRFRREGGHGSRESPPYRGGREDDARPPYAVDRSMDGQVFQSEFADGLPRPDIRMPGPRGHLPGPILQGQVPSSMHPRRNMPPLDKQNLQGSRVPAVAPRLQGAMPGPQNTSQIDPSVHGPRGPITGPRLQSTVPTPLGSGPRMPENAPASINGPSSQDQEIVRPLPGSNPPQTAPAMLPRKISDPLDDPRWAAMRGILENEGTEELVIDAKPFELRMGTSRKLRIAGQVSDVAVDLKDRGIRINGKLVYKLGEPIKEVPAFGKMVRLYYHGLPKPLWLDGQQHEMRLDAPPRNVMVGGERRGFQIDGRDQMILVDRLEKGSYGGPPRRIRIGGNEHEISFQAPPRQIFIDGKPCKLKLDSKIPCIIIDGKPHGIRFDGEPRTVFINDQPFTIPVDRAEKIRLGSRPMYIAFGGPAHEIIVDGKWFEVKFDNTPKDIHLGNRHFSIRLPGPIPRVKILDELSADLDESRLLSSNKMGTDQMPVQGLIRPVNTRPTVPNVGPPDNSNIRPTGMPGPAQVPGMCPLTGGSLPPSVAASGHQQIMQGGPSVAPIAGIPFQQIPGAMNVGGPTQIVNTHVIPGMQNVIGVPGGPHMHGLTNLQAQLVPTTNSLQQSNHSAAMTTGLQKGNVMLHPNIPNISVTNFSHPPPPSNVAPIAEPNLPGVFGLKNLLPAVTTAASTVSLTESQPKAPSVDINSLLNNLLKAGLIKESQNNNEKPAEEDTPPVQQSQPAPKDSAFPVKDETVEKKRAFIQDLTNFLPHDLKIKRKPVIEMLHEGIQCHTCAARFTMNDHEKYRSHLDWHFRQNKLEQEMVKVAKNRKWFYSLTDWIQYEELEETEEKFRSEIFEQMKFSDGDTSHPSVPAFMRALEGKEVIKNPVATGEDLCATCGDPFDQVWNEDTEEWILKNTIRVDGKTYHPVCYEDVQETPTPAVNLPENPLDVQIATMNAKVKTEAMEEETSMPSLTSANVMELSSEQEVKSEEQDMESVSGGDTVAVSQQEAKDLHMPTLLRNIASTLVREVIPVSQEDEPGTSWDMDSNPTPELSRTPTPEPIPSYTPAPSVSSESLAAESQVLPFINEENPIPIKSESSLKEPLSDVDVKRELSSDVDVKRELSSDVEVKKEPMSSGDS